MTLGIRGLQLADHLQETRQTNKQTNNTNNNLLFPISTTVLRQLSLLELNHNDHQRRKSVL